MDSAIEKAKAAIREADAILVGASNGLSIAEGYNIFANNGMFKAQFGDFERLYGIRSVIEGSFFPDISVRKDFLDRLVKLWVTDYVPSDVMKNLVLLIGDKPYFIITSNADTHLELSGFDEDRVFEVEGTFIDAAQNRRPADKSEALHEFISRYHDCRIVILELGIGSRNTLIKQPLMQLAASLPGATYITLNLPHEIHVPVSYTHLTLPTILRV